jgi:hypothetical protein
MRYLDGVYGKQGIFYPVKSPTYLDTEYLDLNTDENEAIKSIMGASVSKRAGFSLHAGGACKAGQGKKRERLCRYITRPAIAERGAAFGLSLAKDGNVIVELKSPYNDGTTHVILSRSRTRGQMPDRFKTIGYALGPAIETGVQHRCHDV